MMRASQAVLIERMAGQIALFGVMFAGFAILPLFPGQMSMPGPVRQTVLWIGVIILGIAGIFAVMHRVPGPLKRMADGFRLATLRGLCAPGVWPLQVVLSLLTVACNLACVAFAARATGTVLPFIAIVTLVPLMLTAMLLPVSAGGWGLREGAAAALWPLVGATAAAGVAASIAFGLVIMVASLPGIVMLLTPRPVEPRPRDASQKADRP
jgi:glycosyltransferase 2 family protein